MNQGSLCEDVGRRGLDHIVFIGEFLLVEVAGIDARRDKSDDKYRGRMGSETRAEAVDVSQVEICLK